MQKWISHKDPKDATAHFMQIKRAQGEWEQHPVPEGIWENLMEMALVPFECAFVSLRS